MPSEDSLEQEKSRKLGQVLEVGTPSLVSEYK